MGTQQLTYIGSCQSGNDPISISNNTSKTEQYLKDALNYAEKIINYFTPYGTQLLNALMNEIILDIITVSIPNKLTINLNINNFINTLNSIKNPTPSQIETIIIDILSLFNDFENPIFFILKELVKFSKKLK
jgi:hypothetical protein